MANVDAQLQRCSGHDGLQAPFLEPLLGLLPARVRQATVMRQDLLFAEPLPQLMGDALGQLAGVDEDERAAVLLDELHQSLVDLGPVLVGADSLEFLPRYFDGQIHVAEVADVHYGGWHHGRKRGLSL